ncbi:hypothetical protein [Shewanella sp. WPAGA9]|uniref:hypothetical protein n=1 Tax=Shewanella sp. ENK2 TaxID=2775245 RepID=UPI00177C79E2|nr:hypothetical protein [Shewanella sp. WPAGA9]
MKKFGPVKSLLLFDPEISKLQFNIIICLLIFWGGLTQYMAISYIPSLWIDTLGFWPILGLFFVSSICGVLMLDKGQPIYIFTGFNLILLGSGTFLCYFLQSLSTEIIIDFIKYAVFMVLFLLFSNVFLPERYLQKKPFTLIATALVILLELVSWWLWGSHSNILSLLVLVLVIGGLSSTWAEANAEHSEYIKLELNDAIFWGAHVSMGFIFLLIQVASRRDDSSSTN